MTTTTHINTTLYSDANGGLGDLPGSSINHATGVISVPVPSELVKRVYDIESGFTDAAVSSEYEPEIPVNVSYIQDSEANQAKTVTLPFAGNKIRVNPDSSDAIVPGSLYYYGSRDAWIDNGQGGMINMLNGIVEGSIDYQTGILDMPTSKTAPHHNGANVRYKVKKGAWRTWSSHFRVKGTNISPGSFFMSVTALDGTELTATTDLNGDFIASDMEGHIDTRSGVVSAYYGQWVADDAAAQAADWYGKSRTDATSGQVWEPRFVVPSTVSHSSVKLTFLPLDKALIGVDGSRLPENGEVPIYRPGDVVIIGTDMTEPLPNTLAIDDIITLSSQNLQYLEVRDADGNVVDPALFEFDRAARDYQDCDCTRWQCLYLALSCR